MFYNHFGQGSSLYELGEVVSGKEDIEKLNGTITVTAYQEQEDSDKINQKSKKYLSEKAYKLGKNLN